MTPYRSRAEGPLHDNATSLGSTVEHGTLLVEIIGRAGLMV